MVIVKTKTKTYPIIISAPHAQSSIEDKSLRNRIALSDYEVWKCSDPFTDELKLFTCARYKQIAKTHRLICDLNRPPNENAFHKEDFFGRKVFKKGKGFSTKEKKAILEKHWKPYHQELDDKILALDKEGHKIILVVEFHNTSGDHPLNTSHAYMPSLIVSNLGQSGSGNKTIENPHISIPAKHLRFFQKEIDALLPLRTEINGVFHGGYNTLWLSQAQKRLKTKAKVYSVQLEYNLDLLVNPLTKRRDRKAQEILHKALNTAVKNLYKKLSSR